MEMDKSNCNYIVPRGEKRGQKCGRNCVVNQGEEPRCFQHKPKHLASKNVKKSLTKSEQFAVLEERNKIQESQIKSVVLELDSVHLESQKLHNQIAQQEDQIGALSEELSSAKAQIASLTKEVASLRNENKRMHAELEKLKQILERANNDLAVSSKHRNEILKKECESLNQANEKLKRENEVMRQAFAKDLEDVKLIMQDAEIAHKKMEKEIASQKQNMEEAINSKTKLLNAKLGNVLEQLQDLESKCTNITESTTSLRKFTKEYIVSMLKNHHTAIKRLISLLNCQRLAQNFIFFCLGQHYGEKAFVMVKCLSSCKILW
eukprot:TRINITY_DN8979_c0_g1_i3.p1 TRINITY_DN8979_c0_g1~~TRINITY_DN8979_c0_g1_i3.p1  ORF type:complete len:334 (+),score=36.03 TRINITY_DN8979_c0_g1_i3:43-1002(+)